MDTTDETSYKVADETVFPDNFPDVGGKTFIWVWEHKKEWVQFTNGMVGTTGFFNCWFQYCQRKLINGGV